MYPIFLNYDAERMGKMPNCADWPSCQDIFSTGLLFCSFCVCYVLCASVNITYFLIILILVYVP